MNKLIVLLITLGMLLVTSPVMAQQEAFLWGNGGCPELVDDLSRCGEKVVELGQELDTMESQRQDNIALAVAGGSFIGAGGITSVLEFIGSLNPFIGVAAVTIYVVHREAEK